ncbi:hypothetical protein [Actinoallomurus iriomotensis]|uniref:Uncharacterized protein n=1 Tax=Actinoallomurus iriomotensis TaxID=478107 RepID=A0A9W6RT72_9ACTN|nr:hypothetical protein [Actinoallomurus iriomotensis]GLY81436.1 hypothetical protein Airi01_097030 [Actinoallomurus iriomotensis]
MAEPVTTTPALQHKVQSVLDELVDTGAETGLQVAVYHHGAHGKTTATLRHVLTHSAGVPAMPRGIGPADLIDSHFTTARRLADLTTAELNAA